MRRTLRPKFPSSAEREYGKRLAAYADKYVSLMRAALKEELPELKDVSAEEQPRFDTNIEQKIERIISLVDKRLASYYPDAVLMRWSMAMINKVNGHTKREVNKMFRDQVVDDSEEPNFVGLMKDKGISDFFMNVAEENVGLIKSIPKLKQPAFKNMLVANLTADMPARQLQAEIVKHFNVTKGRAKMIARDQTGKMNGRLEEYRQKQLGLKEYIWRTSEDERVREDHKRLDGRKFRWDKPPVVDRRTGRRGNPKQDYLCRCWAEPVFDED